MLTDVLCRTASTGPKKIRKLPDGDGLYLWVYSDGRKYWRYRYWFGGKEKSLSIGVYPAVSLKTARRRCAEERERLGDDLDPSAERRAAKIATKIAVSNSFESVAREWFSKREGVWVPRHAVDVRRRLEANLFPHIGARPISQIDGPELLSVVRKVEARGAHDLAHRILQVSSQVFRYGVATGRCARDIVPDLRGALTPHKHKHQAAVSPENLPALLKAIDGYSAVQGGDVQTQLALELLALTFVRTTELIEAVWPEFDFAKKLWVIPAERMKMNSLHVVPLSSQVLTRLERLKKIGGNSDYVFPGRSRDKPISNNTMLFALYRLGYKGKMTGHGFRAVASTILNEQGFRADVIERQLAHADPSEVRGAYNRAIYLIERTEMMQKWADYLDLLRES
jgi:integrase